MPPLTLFQLYRGTYLFIKQTNEIFFEF